MTPDKSFGRKAALLVLGSVRIGVSTYKWQGLASVRFTMQESILILFHTLREIILILFRTLLIYTVLPPIIP